MSNLRVFLAKHDSIVNARFSLFVPLSRLSVVVRFLACSTTYHVKNFVVKPCMKDGSIISVLCSMPASPVDVDESQDILFFSALHLKNALTSLSLPESADIDLSDLVDDFPF